jgi:hypothetical protein
MATIKEQNGHIAANAESRVENEAQKHAYCENESAGHLTAEFEHKGEDPAREEVASKATAGRHVKSKDGLQVAAERKAHVEANRKASAAIFDSNKLSVVPEQKGRKRK